MAGWQGPSERYAPLGLSFPPLSRRAPSAHEAADGYAAPTAPAGITCPHFCDFKSINEVVFEDIKI